MEYKQKVRRRILDYYAEYTSIPDYNDGSFNLYQNELMNFFIFLTKVHPAFILDKSLKA